MVDSHQLMLSMLGDFESACGVCAWRSNFFAVEEDFQGVTLQIADGYSFRAAKVVNAAGLGALGLTQQSMGGITVTHMRKETTTFVQDLCRSISWCIPCQR